MQNDKQICIYHEQKVQTLQDHAERLAVIEVEVEHMKSAQAEIMDRFDSAASANEVALKDVCAEVKKINIRLAGLFSDPEAFVRKKPTADASKTTADEVLGNEPIGWANSALKKFFKSQTFWILFGWVVVKIVFFGEYPWFTEKPRPYMKSIVESQQQLSEQHKALHEAEIKHLHDEKGNPVLVNNGNGKPNK